MQYAIEELGFPVNKIFIYAWSIGGYPAVCGAKVYPQIGGMVLDATFDDIVPLAQTKMPDSICKCFFTGWSLKSISKCCFDKKKKKKEKNMEWINKWKDLETEDRKGDGSI